MKTSTFSVLILLSLLAISGCKKDPDPEPEPEPTQQEIVTEMLKGTWPLTSVTIEGDNGAELFKDFTLTFTESTYTTTGTTPVWKRSGTWTFTNDDATAFKRDDNIEVTIETVDDNNLKLVLFWNEETSEPGRTRSLRGRHEFILTK